MGGHANYAPCALDDLVNKGYDYWALGHVHQGEILHERPHVVFPGNLQGRHIRETGPKGACLVTVAEREVADVATIHVEVVRWASIIVSVEGCERAGDVVERVHEAIEETVARDADGRLLACRIQIRGRAAIHAQLLASREHLLAEARAAALGLGEETAWLERVIIATEPLCDQPVLPGRDDALGYLQRLSEDPTEIGAVFEQIGSDIGEFVRKLPHEVRVDTEDALLEAAIHGDYEGLVKKAGDSLTSRITEEGK